ncbi:MAG: PAS domain S-box protein [Chitinophagaceae bacterium]
MSRLYTRKNIIISFIIIAIVVLFTAYFTYRSNREAHWQTERVKESQQSMQVIEDLMDDLQDIETGQRGFFITRTPYFLEPYSIALKKIPADTQAVRNLIPLYPQRRGMISSLLGSTRRKLDVSNAIVDLVRAGKYDSAQRVIFSGAGKQFMDSIRQITDLILKQDRALFLKSELQRQEASRNSAILLISLLSLSLGVLSWLLWQYFIGESMRRDNREKLQYLARLTEQAGDAIFSTNLSGLILSWNTGAEKLFGYSKEQVTGKFIPGIKLGGFSLDQISKLTGQGIENEPITIEGYHLNRDQNGFDYSASITTLNNEKNEQTGFLILLRDITERKKAEKLLSRFNEELAMQVEEKTALVRNVVGRIRDGFYSLDNEWRFTYVNEYMYELTGKTPGELMGHTIWEAFPDVVNTPAHEALTFAVREQKQQAIDFYFPPLGKWFSSQLYPSPTGISVFFRDVSEVKNAEMEIRRSNERFNLIGRTTRDAIWEWNCETGEIWGNEVHQQLYGLTLEDPVPSEKEWQNRLHPDDRERIIDEQEKALASDRNVFITEYRFRTDFNG